MANNKAIAAGVAAVLAIAAPIVARWEGLKYQPYPDPATGGAPWTVCYGHTGPDVVPGKGYTKADCDALLDADMAAADAAVRRCIPVPMLRHVEGALVSLVFNVGPRAVCGSTIQKYALANNWPAACEAIEAWKYAGGRVMRGLALRRADEKAMCLGEK